MLNCRTARQYVQRGLDGELSAPAREALHEHLDVCESCRVAYRQFVMMQAAMRELASESDRAGEEFPPIEFTPSYRLGRSLPWWVGLAAAAVVALCVSGWFAASAVRTNTAKSPQLALNQPHPTSTAPETRTPETGTGAPEPGTRPDVRVTFAVSSDVIAVPRPTKNPNVTVIWVYPAVKTKQAPDDRKHGTSAPAERNQT